MKFCERCNVATESDACPNCNKKTRQILNEDMCLFGEYETLKSDMFIGALASENIPYAVKADYLFAFKAKYALPDMKKIFIRYCDFDKAKEIYTTMFEE